MLLLRLFQPERSTSITRRMLTVELVDNDGVVAFARTQPVVVDLILEFAGAEADAQHAVLDLIALPRTCLQHADTNSTVTSEPGTIFERKNKRTTTFGLSSFFHVSSFCLFSRITGSSGRVLGREHLRHLEHVQ